MSDPVNPEAVAEPTPSPEAVAAPPAGEGAPPAEPFTPPKLRINEMRANRDSRGPRKPFKPRDEKPREPDVGPRVHELPKLRELDAQIEDELNSAMAEISDKKLLDDPPAPKKIPGVKIAPNPLKTGKIVGIHIDDVFVEMPGSRGQGVLSMAQFPDGPPEIGSTVEVQIVRYDRADGLLVLTREGAVEAAQWSTVHIGMIVEARCIEVNKGGMAVEVNGLRGFLPISQIDQYRVENADAYVGQRLRCMVVEVDVPNKNLVVSRRALLEQERADLAAKLWEELAEGQVKKAMIRQIKPFGAFADIGGIDGLIPISEMSWTRIKDPSEVVTLGETVEVVVTRIDRDAKKVSLSLRQTKASPWDTAHFTYPSDSVVTGTVTRLEPFGAFVQLEPGIEGLVHISELSGSRVRRSQDAVSPGQQVQVKILNVDRDQRRISLSIKQVREKEIEEAIAAEADEAPAAPVKPRVKNPNLRGGTGTPGPLFPQLGQK
ncbi:MAG: S1 RNA-binding domain-containing protein [Gemmataceae bacterium]|nr:S1 RNA-binding domain-containing protein [Gemmataceae bacterium]